MVHHHTHSFHRHHRSTVLSTSTSTQDHNEIVITHSTTRIRRYHLSPLLTFLPLEREDPCCTNGVARKETRKSRIQGPPTPTEDDEAPIPTEHVRISPNLNRTVIVQRKAAKRTFPFELAIDEIQLASSQRQAEGILDRKRPRLEKPSPTSTNEATTKNTGTSYMTMVALATPHTTASAAASAKHTGSDPVMHMHPNARYRGARRRCKAD
eukprot:scaffold41423_cov34-Attheya_sp.AAC.2